jgi:isocitrate/isopropylmalate dehydrogenase
MFFITKPEMFDVIVTTNLFGVYYQMKEPDW